MITSADAITVLCFGDSNTHGQRAEEVAKGRWPADTRWTGQLQDLLGDGYYVIEEGMGGRTTDVDYADLVGRNGRTYLLPCLHTHDPLDVVVLMLGTNDLKVQFDRSAVQIVAAIGGLIDDIEAYAVDHDGNPSKIILLSPVPIDDQTPMFAEVNSALYDASSVVKSRQLAAQLHTFAAQRRVLFADTATVGQVGADGVHLSIDSHRGLAKLIADKVVEALSR